MKPLHSNLQTKLSIVDMGGRYLIVETRFIGKPEHPPIAEHTRLVDAVEDLASRASGHLADRLSEWIQQYSVITLRICDSIATGHGNLTKLYSEPNRTDDSGTVPKADKTPVQDESPPEATSDPSGTCENLKHGMNATYEKGIAHEK